MRTLSRRGFGIWVIGVYLVLLVIVVRVSVGGEPVPSATGWPAPEELDSLQHYLVPVAESPATDDYEAYPPAMAPADAEGPVDLPAAAPPRRIEYRLSAILISGAHPVAIIDDQPVRRGGRIAGGAEVVAIDADRVVVRDAEGMQRVLRLTVGTEEPDGE